MHIAHVLTRLLRAGSEENTLATCRWQIDAGHKVTLIHGADYDPYWDRHLPHGVRRVSLPEMAHPIRPVQDMRAVRQLRRLYRDIQPDVVHTHQSKAGILGRMAASCVPAAIVAHGIHIVPFDRVSRSKRALYIAAEKRVARHTDVFMAVSDAVGQSYISAGIAQAGQVHCVRSGMDLVRFSQAHPPPDWRQLLGVSQGDARPRVAVMMAAFEPRKQHLPFLRAFAKVAAMMPDLKLLLAGAGPQEHHVRAAVLGLGLQDHVVFCGHRSDPESLFALADMSILTSANEGLPRVVIQSIAAGCPPLVQDLPGLDEVLTHGTNGWIAPPNDMDAAVRQMCKLLKDTVLLARLKRGANQTDLSAWALDSLGAQTTALYGVPHRSPVLPNKAALELA